MDAEIFDRLVRALTGVRTRRGLLSLLAGLPLVSTIATLLPDEADAAGRRKRHKHQQGDGKKNRNGKHQRPSASEPPPSPPSSPPSPPPTCVPLPQTTTCAGKCAMVANNCGEQVDCGPCPCTPACQQCQTCAAATGQCVPLTNGTACNDGNACTQADTCQSGICVGSNSVVCTPLDQCHAAGVCNPVTGVCSTPNETDGTACNGGNACTQTDICQGGLCMGTNPVACLPPADVCHVQGTCNPTTGQYVYPNAPNDTSCDDGNLCTTGDTCQSGVCTGMPVVCPPPTNECQTDTCNPATGSCNKLNGTPCSGGNICCNGTCWDGCCGSDGSPASCRVFVTSTVYNGNLGGLDGAAAKCQARAAAGNQPGGTVPGTYQAWLSDSTGSPSTRFRRSAQPYQMPNGTAIASSYADLVAGPGIDSALDQTEFHGQVAAVESAWTNTRHDGTPGGSQPFSGEQCPNYPFNDHCMNWGSFAESGDVGQVDQTTCAWTAFARGNCDVVAFHLYCFQQR